MCVIVVVVSVVVVVVVVVCVQLHFECHVKVLWISERTGNACDVHIGMRHLGLVTKEKIHIESICT